MVIPNNNTDNVFTFLRKNDGNTVFAVFNLSPQSIEIELKCNLADGDYREYFSDKLCEIVAVGKSIKLKPWEYLVYIKL